MITNLSHISFYPCKVTTIEERDVSVWRATLLINKYSSYHRRAKFVINPPLILTQQYLACLDVREPPNIFNGWWNQCKYTRTSNWTLVGIVEIFGGWKLLQWLTDTILWTFCGWIWMGPSPSIKHISLCAYYTITERKQGQMHFTDHCVWGEHLYWCPTSLVLYRKVRKIKHDVILVVSALS